MMAWRRYAINLPHVEAPANAPLNPAEHSWACWSDVPGKPGWIGRWRSSADAASRELRFRVRVTLMGHVVVGFLRSYSLEMGRASLMLNGDESSAVTLDGHWQSNTSQLDAVAIPVTRLVGTQNIMNRKCNCTTVAHPAKVTLSFRMQAPEPRSGSVAAMGTKFKLLSLTTC